MNIRYFSSAWNDIKNSPSWVGKLAILALVALIPVFGWIVVAGYMYGWARSIAWGVHSPMPQHIFGEGDDKPYARGFYALIILLVVSLIPAAVTTLSNLFYVWSAASHFWLLAFCGIVIDIAGIALSIVITIFGSICCVRMAIYGSIGAGFQFGRVLKMIKHDTDGVLRLSGLSLVAALIAVVLITAISTVFAIIVFFALGAGFLAWASTGAAITTSSVAAFLASSAPFLIFVVVLSLVLLYLLIIVALFADLLIIRATGYWVYQFEVPQWGSQDDPMPFERAV